MAARRSLRLTGAEARTMSLKWAIAAFFVGALAASAVAPARALACGGRLIFADTFETLDRSWGAPDSQVSVSNRIFFLRSDANRSNGRLNRKYLYRDADICVSAALASGSDPASMGALIFWALDADNFYALAINGQGEFSVLRKSAGQWQLIRQWQRTGSANPGVGRWNNLEVVTVGNRATALINGVQVADITGEPSPSGALIGLLAAASAKSPAAWAFANVYAGAPSPAQPVPAQAGGASLCQRGQVLFEDDFQTLDRSWGPPDAFDAAQSGLFRVEAGPGQQGGRLSEKYLYRDANICVGANLSRAPGSSAAGIAFWAQDNDNYYLAAISGSGTFAILRRRGGQWSMVTTWQSNGALRRSAATWNDLGVATRGDRATFYVNAVAVAQVSGEPPAGGGLIGLFAFSSAGGRSLWYFRSLRVTYEAPAIARASPTPPPAPAPQPTPQPSLAPTPGAITAATPLPTATPRAAPTARPTPTATPTPPAAIRSEAGPRAWPSRRPRQGGAA